MMRIRAILLLLVLATGAVTNARLYDVITTTTAVHWIPPYVGDVQKTVIDAGEFKHSLHLDQSLGGYNAAVSTATVRRLNGTTTTIVQRTRL